MSGADFPHLDDFGTTFLLHLKNNKFRNAVFKKSKIKIMFNWRQINFWRKFSFLEAFQVFYFCCDPKRRPDFEISDFTE